MPVNVIKEDTEQTPAPQTEQSAADLLRSTRNPFFKWISEKYFFANVSLLFLLSNFVAITALVYIARERFFYDWDLSLYQELTIRLVDKLRQSPSAAFELLQQSMGWDYNLIFTLPLVPFVFLFGENRASFIDSLAIVYLVPFLITVGLVARRLINGPPRLVFWSAVLITLLTPVVWGPTLRGYPDTGAALLIILALWVYLLDRRLKHWWQIPVIGFLIGLSILFRRHFIYSGTAFFVSALLYNLTELRSFSRQNFLEPGKKLLAQYFRLGLVGVVTLITLLVLGNLFVNNLLKNNFGALYSSYEHPWSEVVGWFGWQYGLLGIGLAILGYGLAVYFKLLKTGSGFVILFGLVEMVQWIFLVTQLGIHYTLHFSLLLVMGLVLVGWTVWLKAGKGFARAGGLAGLAIFLIINFVMGLTPLGFHRDSLTPTFLASATAPLKDSNYDRVAQLVSYLREKAKPEDKIYLVASSFLMNSSRLKNAEATLFANDTHLDVLVTPDVDSRDSYPLTNLIEAQYVVVFDPFQYHLSIKEQGLVKVSYDMFTQNWGFAQDFVLLPDNFSFIADGNTIVAKIYKRTRPSSLQTVVSTLNTIQTVYTPRLPGGQKLWIAAEPVFKPVSYWLTDTSTNLLTILGSNGVTLSSHLLFVRTPPGQKWRISGSLQIFKPECKAVKLNFLVLDGLGQEVQKQTLLEQRTGSPIPFSIDLSIRTPDSRVVVEVADTGDGQTFDYCPVQLSVNSN